MKRHNVVRARSGVAVLGGLVPRTAASCGDDDVPSSPAPSATSAPAASSAPASTEPRESSAPSKNPNKPGDGVPNNGDGDADG